MTNSILLQNVSPEALVELIKEGVKNQLEDFKKSLNTHDPDELLTREQACEFLHIHGVTLWHWTRRGIVTAYGIGNRRYYKKAELLDCLKPLKK
ncbi:MULTISPECIES: helix-turn-helix domain-containing protein [Flavobacterium]|uniref:helix-turn-helix domain-containing protein n=1 Tax=Flavobacterium TaxID=237 RepID=UPI001FCC3EB4|nr:MULTISPECIES: helix-turn-helix domain-containing protein [Flavobacterium]UOK41591.1 helix-turn-helix domain-containing protein [Flavobacterium enshiense]